MSEINASHVPPGAMSVVELNGEAYAVANLNGNYYAFSDTCTHLGCSLHVGKIVAETQVQCPCHGAVFDLQGYPDPEYLKMSIPPLPVLDARVVHGTVYVLGV